jgi:hypothetical protein
MADYDANASITRNHWVRYGFVAATYCSKSHKYIGYGLVARVLNGPVPAKKTQQFQH